MCTKGGKPIRFFWFTECPWPVMTRVYTLSHPCHFVVFFFSHLENLIKTLLNEEKKKKKSLPHLRVGGAGATDESRFVPKAASVHAHFESVKFGIK